MMEVRLTLSCFDPLLVDVAQDLSHDLSVTVEIIQLQNSWSCQVLFNARLLPRR